MKQLEENKPIKEDYKIIQSQLVVKDGHLYRSIKLPLEGAMTVPVLPTRLVPDVVAAAHKLSGHASWEKMYYMLHARLFFPGIAATCQEYLASCERCAAANTSRGPSVRATRACSPGRPWSEVVLDTLELGAQGSSSNHCVLICVDTFSKWLELVPLRRHDALSVASAFVKICAVWGAPDIVRTDNGTEFQNAIVETFYKVMGVRVRTGAVRHPQSQGSAERANRTIIGMIRKVLYASDDWEAAIDLLLFQYRNRPHSTTGLTPTEVMIGWKPVHLILQSHNEAYSLSAWVDRLQQRSAAIRDLIDE